MKIDAAITKEDHDILINGKPGPNILDKLPACYHDLADAFSKKDADILPTYHAWY
jgi:hypothetical protein